MTAPRRCSATYPLGDGLVVRCGKNSGHKGSHEPIVHPTTGSQTLFSWPRKKKEGK